MNTTPTKEMTARLYRFGATPEDDNWEGSTVEERIEAVWLLTRLCLLWKYPESDEPRLQRTATRLQRRES